MTHLGAFCALRLRWDGVQGLHDAHLPPREGYTTQNSILILVVHDTLTD